METSSLRLEIAYRTVRADLQHSRIHLANRGPAISNAGARSLTLNLDDWYDNSATPVGRAILTQRGRDVVVRIELKRPRPNFFPLRVKIYGGQTRGISYPKTDCEVVYNNAMTVLEPGTVVPDAGLSVRQNLGTIRSVPAVRTLRGTTIEGLRRRGDSFAVWNWGLIFACSDL